MIRPGRRKRRRGFHFVEEHLAVSSSSYGTSIALFPNHRPFPIGCTECARLEEKRERDRDWIGRPPTSLTRPYEAASILFYLVSTPHSTSTSSPSRLSTPWEAASAQQDQKRRRQASRPHDRKSSTLVFVTCLFQPFSPRAPRPLTESPGPAVISTLTNAATSTSSNRHNSARRPQSHAALQEITLTVSYSPVSSHHPPCPLRSTDVCSGQCRQRGWR